MLLICSQHKFLHHAFLNVSPRFLLSTSLGSFTALVCPPDMEFLEVLTEGLNRVLLVRGGGREVITIYSWTAPRDLLRGFCPLLPSMNPGPTLVTLFSLRGADLNTDVAACNATQQENNWYEVCLMDCTFYLLTVKNNCKVCSCYIINLFFFCHCW